MTTDSNTQRCVAMRAPGFESTQAPLIGDWWCPGVSIAQFKKTNRAPVFGGKWNRWILARTGRDHPNHTDILRSTAAVFAQWFKTSLNAAPWDPIAVYDLGRDAPAEKRGLPTTRHDDADLLHVVSVTRKQPVVADGKLARQPSGRLAGVENLEALITIEDRTRGFFSDSEPEAPIWITVDFVWRRQDTDLPWPVHKVQMINPWCPIKADWALWYVLKPLSLSVPKERTPAQKAVRQVEKRVEPYRPTLSLTAAAVIAAAGAYVVYKLT